MLAASSPSAATSRPHSAVPVDGGGTSIHLAHCLHPSLTSSQQQWYPTILSQFLHRYDPHRRNGCPHAWHGWSLVAVVLSSPGSGPSSSLEASSVSIPLALASLRMASSVSALRRCRPSCLPEARSPPHFPWMWFELLFRVSFRLSRANRASQI